MRSAIKGMLTDMRSLFAKAALLCAAVAVLMVPGTALAANDNSWLPKTQLTVHGEYGEVPVPGVYVDVYYVGEIGEGGTILPAESFASYDVLWDVSTSGSCQELANALEAYVLSDSVVPTSSAVTDEEGSATFPDGLAPGWHLILAEHLSSDGDALEVTPMLLGIIGDERTQEAMLKMSKPPVEEFVTIDVFKAWKDDGSNRPSKIEVVLLRDGEAYQTAELSDANGWHYAWKDLSATYKWNVIEKVVPEGYKVSVSKDGNYITLTNTREPGEEEPPPPGVPQTGGMWWPVVVLLAVGVAMFSFGVARRSRG